jgi:hypothetical protein
MAEALTEIQIRQALTKLYGSFQGFRDLSSYDTLESTAVGRTKADQDAGIQAVYVPSEAELRAALVNDDVALNQIKDEGYRAMAMAIDAVVAPLEAAVPRGEIASWGTKEASARAFLAGAAAAQDEALLRSEADITGESLGSLAERIVAKADTYRVRAGQIAGFRQKYGNQIAAAKTVDEVRAILAEVVQEAPGALSAPINQQEE